MANNYNQPHTPTNKGPTIIASAEALDSNLIECNNYWKYNVNSKNESMTILPNFDDFQTLYTKCDHRLEQCAHEYILNLEDQFKDHHELVKKEMDIQDKLLDVIWIESQRFLLLTQSVVCVKLYPEIISVPTENRALCKFHKNLKQIKHSNCLIGISLENIRLLRDKLNHFCNQLDVTVKSPFISGNYYLQPLANVREILEDLYNYFNMQFWKLKCWAQLLDPVDTVANNNYAALVKSNKYNDN